MLRTGRISGKNRSRRLNNGAINPLDGVANLADIMLVFACGLMLALLVRWNLSFDSIQPTVLSEENMIELKDMEAVSDSITSKEYEEKGKVYVDPETGEMYLITK